MKTGHCLTCKHAGKWMEHERKGIATSICALGDSDVLIAVDEKYVVAADYADVDVVMERFDDCHPCEYWKDK